MADAHVMQNTAEMEVTFNESGNTILGSYECGKKWLRGAAPKLRLRKFA